MSGFLQDYRLYFFTVIIALKLTKETKRILIRTTEFEEYLLTNNIIIRGPLMDSANIVEVVIPKGITLIDEEAFLNCESLTTVTLPSSIEMIRRNAFLGCKNLQTVIPPDSISEIESWGERRAYKHSFNKPFAGLAKYLREGDFEIEYNPDFDWR